MTCHMNNDKKGRTIKLAIITSLIVSAALGVVIWAITKDSSASSSVADRSGVDTSHPDDHSGNHSNDHSNEHAPVEPDEERTLLLYEVPIVNNPSTDYVEGSFLIYSKHLLSNPLNVTYYVSIDFAESSTITNIFGLNENSDKRYDDENEWNSLCFTDNLFLLERNLISDNDIHLKHPNHNIPQQNPISTVDINNAMTTTSNHTMCIHHIDKVMFPHQLPVNFHPHNYGAAAIVRSSKDASPTTTLYSLGNLFYAQRYQRSMYPTLKTDLIETSDIYVISGRINVRGKVKRASSSNNTYDLADVPVFKFEDISLSLQPPGLFLFLTTRSAWMRFSKDDIFIHMEEDNKLNLPDGTFNKEGSYNMDWPLEGEVDIRDYKDGYWFLWCTNFTLTLAGGPIEIVDEY